MKTPVSKRRLAENESFFRKSNESVTKELMKLRKVAIAEGGLAMVEDDLDKPIQFYCECSDEDCRERIKLRPSEYRRIHKDRRRFIVLPGHVVGHIETVISSNDNYTIVKKTVKTPAKAERLNSTPLDHS